MKPETRMVTVVAACAAAGLKISGSEMSDKVYRFRLDRQAALE